MLFSGLGNADFTGSGSCGYQRIFDLHVGCDNIGDPSLGCTSPILAGRANKNSLGCITMFQRPGLSDPHQEATKHLRSPPGRMPQDIIISARGSGNLRHNPAFPRALSRLPSSQIDLPCRCRISHVVNAASTRQPDQMRNSCPGVCSGAYFGLSLLS